MGGRQAVVRRTGPVVLLTLVLSACGQGENSSNLEAAGSPATAAWTNVDVRPVSRPVATGGRFVFYNRTGRHTLEVVGLDPATGDVAWRHDAAWSGITGGVALPLMAEGDEVYFLQAPNRSRPGLVDVVAVHADTGRQIWRTADSYAVTDAPRLCPDGDGSLCITGSRGGIGVLLVVSRADGGVSTPAKGLGRQLGPEIYETGSRTPETLARVTTNGTVWRRPLKSVFPGRDVSTDSGWSFERYGDVFVGTVPAQTKVDRSGPMTFDVSALSTAGFDAARGSNLWVEDGSFLGCPDAFVLNARDDHTPAVRCRYTGHITVDPHTNKSTLSKNFQVTVEGFDVHTGQTSWSAGLGDAPGLLGEQPSLIRLGSSEFLVRKRTGKATVLNIATGAQRAVAAPDTSGWCTKVNEYEADVAGKKEPRVGQAYAYPCSADGKAAETAAQGMEGMSATVGDVTAWAAPDGVHAQR